MIRHRIVLGALTVALVALSAVPVEGQLPTHLRGYSLAPLSKSGDLVTPFFDGWYDNGDGTVTFSFGFMNRNLEEVVDIPLGPNNYIEPAEFDGMQPTHFPVYDPQIRPGQRGRSSAVPRGLLRERGAFAVTAPAGTEVVWTLTHAGHTYSIPGRATSEAYEMSRGPAAFGSLPPAIRFEEDGPESTDREGIRAERVTTSVGSPITLSALVRDRGKREAYEGADIYPVNATWLRHQGSGQIRFEPQVAQVDSEGWGEATTRATFSEPGEYVVRLRVDNFEAPDTGFGFQCCWSNAYVPVTVTP